MISKMVTRKATGFTLIELLVVVTIIVILMASLMPVYSKIQLKARREATQATIMTLNAAMERYKVDFDAYPPNPSGGTEDDGSIFEYLNGKDGRGVIANPGTPRQKHFEPYLTLGREFMRPDAGKFILVDSWGQPLHYFNCKAFVEEKSGNPKHCHNPTSIDIYSTGQDKKRDPELIEPGTGEVKERSETKLVDDITNF